jgi:cobalt/nickel transport protein
MRPTDGMLNSPMLLFFVAGHPYEQEYSITPKPDRAWAMNPDGSETDLTDAVQPGTYDVDGMSVDVWNFLYTPTMRGDSVIAVNKEPEFGFNNTMYQEFIKLVIHTEEINNWDQRTNQPIEIVPLTRPYGMEEGFVFTGRLMKGDEPLAGATILIEEFLEHIPALADLPAEPFITREVKTDVNGVFSHTLPRASWWIFAAEVEDAGEIERDGVTYQLNGLTALWVKVDKAIPPNFSTTMSKWANY